MFADPDPSPPVAATGHHQLALIWARKGKNPPLPWRPSAGSVGWRTGDASCGIHVVDSDPNDMALTPYLGDGRRRRRRSVMAEQSGKTRFIRGNDRVDRLVADPLIAEDVARYAAERAEVNRIYAQGLADIRKAGNLTQTEVAKILDTDQGTVSRIENRDDLLLSTLRQYLAATGAVHAKIVVEKEGVEITLDLDSFASSALG